MSVHIYYTISTDTRKRSIVLRYKERKEYLKKYREKMKQVRFDFKPETKEKLQQLAKDNNKTMTAYIIDLIDEEYKKR